MWEDSFFVSLSKNAKILFMYLITNQRINLCGCYEISDRVLVFDTGLTNSELKKAKEDLFPKARFYDGWVYLENAKRLGGYKGEKNEEAIRKELSKIPDYITDVILEPKQDRVSINIDGVSCISDTSINNKSEIINNKSEIRDKKKNLDDDDLEKISKSLSVSFSTVSDYYAKLLDYVKTKNRDPYKDYAAALRNWIRRDLESGKIRKVLTEKFVERKEISDEVRKENIRRMQEIKDKIINRKEV